MLDTTLREGAQTYGVSFSLQDKLSIAKRLDDLGVAYIEGGWPGSNPKDVGFFKAVKSLPLSHSKIAAFTSTKRKDSDVEKDAALKSVLEADVDNAVVFGKAWYLHVREVLHATLSENLEMIEQSISYLKSNGLEVIFDAEHFFDGYKDRQGYALRVVECAGRAGAHTVVLCDTNGGTLPGEVESAVRDVRKKIDVRIGIHTHNDAGLAVANTMAAVSAGATHVQGTVNGLGERCGMADLCQILPTLHFKMGLKTLNSKRPFKEQLDGLTALSHYVYDLTNITPYPRQPYVGRSAFAHKGGVHIDAVLKHFGAYEHIDPVLIGNMRELSLSELSGRSGIVKVASELGLKLDRKSRVVDRVLREIKRLESEGYHFENAKASVHLIILREAGLLQRPFEIESWRAASSKDEREGCTGRVIVKVNGRVYREAAKGVGPVHALDVALRKALSKRFPRLRSVNLVNYKVTVVEGVKGTASVVRVFIEFEENGIRWATTGVSPNILEASISALAEGYIYRLVLDRLQKRKM